MKFPNYREAFGHGDRVDINTGFTRMNRRGSRETAVRIVAQNQAAILSRMTTCQRLARQFDCIRLCLHRNFVYGAQMLVLLLGLRLYGIYLGYVHIDWGYLSHVLTPMNNARHDDFMPTKFSRHSFEFYVFGRDWEE